MYLSKFWFFLVTVLAVLAITIALVMPRPAERAAIQQEEKTVRKACMITQILLRDNARSRIQNTSSFAQAVRQAELAETLSKASDAEIISPELNGIGRRELTKLLENVPAPKPSFVWLLDSQGRVVARSNLEDKTFGDSMRGYYAVQDALDGYVRDDLWMMTDGLYRVTAAPVLTKKLAWAGAIVLGRSMDKAFASTLSKSIDANISFYVSGDSVASSNPVQIHKEVIQASEELVELEEGQDCNMSTIVDVTAGSDSFRVVSARLPGEAGEQGAFYSVFVKQATALDFMGMLKASKKGDLSFDQFPWIFVGLLFVVLLAIGFFLMNREVDSPLKKLGANAVDMAKGSSNRFDESQHKGKYGSIARSVNIGIEKSERDAKAAKKDLDQLLGPAPSAAVSAAASALPPVVAAPPPPGDFKFSSTPKQKPPIPTPTPRPRAMPGMTPTPQGNADSLASAPRVAKMKSATDMQVAPPPVALPSAITEDILAKPSKKFIDDEMPTMINDMPGENYFQQVYEEFIALKTSCGESTENLTFERFAKKLQKNKDALIAKHNCESVTFQVYAKDGKAALKASPVK